MPKVSVIVPIYGVENYIERCAKSLFEQTLNDIEILFINDCTLDGSMKVLEKVIDKYLIQIRDKKYIVRTLKMPTNSGLPAVRRYGIQLCTGDYIIHCDSDDWIEFRMLEKMYLKAQENKADIVVCDYMESDGQDYNIIHKGCRNAEKDIFLRNVMLQKYTWALWNKLVRRDLYINNEFVFPQKNMGEDMATVIQLLWHSNSIAYVEEPLYFYYQNNMSITRQKNETAYYRMYVDLKDNVAIVSNLFKRNEQMPHYCNEIKYLEENCRSFLLPIIGKKKYRDEYLEAFPQNKYNLLDCFDRKLYISAIRYICIKYHIYKTIAKIKEYFYGKF